VENVVCLRFPREWCRIECLQPWWAGLGWADLVLLARKRSLIASAQVSSMLLCLPFLSAWYSSNAKGAA